MGSTSYQRYALAAMFIMIMMIFAGCATQNQTEDRNRISVITTIYPLYDFTQKIGAEHVDVTLLIPTGVDPHDWAPKPQDMVRISNADILIYNGLGFEGWMDTVLRGIHKDSQLVSLEASHGVDAILLGEHDDHEHDEVHDHDHGHGQFDPHVWLSPLQAKKIAENIKDVLIEIDPANQTDFEKNYEKLLAALEELHQQYTEVISASPRSEIIVSHSAFAYLTRDYGITQIAVMGLSPNAEPTAQELKRITDFIHEHEVQYILFEELVSPKLVETLATDAGIKTLVLNPLEGLTEAQAAAGEDYISMMKRNLASLQQALQ